MIGKAAVNDRHMGQEIQSSDHTGHSEVCQAPMLPPFAIAMNQVIAMHAMMCIACRD